MPHQLDMPQQVGITRGVALLNLLLTSGMPQQLSMSRQVDITQDVIFEYSPHFRHTT